MAALSRRELCYWRNDPTACRHLHECAVGYRRKHDDTVSVPCSTTRLWGIRKHLHRARGQIESLQFAVSEKAHCAAIRRPKGKGGTLSAWKGLRCCLVERSHPQLWPLFSIGHEHQLPPVG